MPKNLDPADIYRREAARLRSMATSEKFSAVRDGLLNVARQYDVLADQSAGIRRHTFGRPLSRPSLDAYSEAEAHRGADGRRADSHGSALEHRRIG